MAEGKKGRSGRKPGSDLSPNEARRLFLAEVATGATNPTALAKVGRSLSWYEASRRDYPEFKRDVDNARAVLKEVKTTGREPVGDFASFRRTFLNRETYPHQQGWIDLLEGREPELFHPAIEYQPGQASRILINTPPAHAKSQTVSIDYVVYRICKNPDTRVILVSKTQKMAQQFLYGIKQRLTHPAYAKLQANFSPEGGFKKTADSWTANQIYLGGEERDGQEKDPTVQAIGIGGQIYVARADLIIIDDAVVLANAAEWEKHMDWLRIEVSSRLAPTGKLLVIGTRVAPIDLYQQLMNGDHYVSGTSPWTRFSQPAVLDYGGGNSEDWLTLWPKAEVPFEGSEGEEPDEDGLFRRWDGPHLDNVRGAVGPRIWSMVYQQQDVSEDAIFHPAAVRGSVNGMRKVGPLNGQAAGHPANPEGFYIVCGLDPAADKDTAAIAMAVDRQSGKRYILDAARMSGATPSKIYDLVTSWTDRYRPQEWVIESNAFQLYLVHDENLNKYLNARGCVIKPHYTSRINKWDEGFGVASMSTLFGTIETASDKNRVARSMGDNLIELPLVEGTEGLKALVEQLVSWQPKTRNKTDLVMALWFCELSARAIIGQTTSDMNWFTKNPYSSPRSMSQRAVIDLNEWAATRNEMVI